MHDQGDSRERLARLLGEVAVHEGPHATPIDGVQVNRTTTSSHGRIPVIYHPKILVVGRGSKRAILGGEVYRYDPFNYLVLSVPLPAECEWEASPEDPLLILSINVEPAMLGEMLLEMDDLAPPAGPTPRGISSSPMSEAMGEAVIRLLECLKSPLESRMLGRQAVREIIFRACLGEQGGALRALANRDDHFSRIARVLRQVHTEYTSPMSVEEMARRAGMSVAAFHHYFKLVTASSPLQYIKRIRLDRARMLMSHEGYNASTASRAVGYESASQFCREFKRLFGTTPLEDAEKTRARLVAG
jgi:AraC-like DNA-binding protein